MGRLGFFLLMGVCGLLISRQSISDNTSASATQPLNVILISWDGVRLEEFFNGVDPSLVGGMGTQISPFTSAFFKPFLLMADKHVVFPYLWGTLAQRGVIYGEPGSGREMTVSNPMNISLPAYQSIMVGKQTNCLSNDCPRVAQETFPERLVRELGFQKNEVVLFSSWDRLAFAMESVEGTTTVNVGITPFEDTVVDEELLKLNKLQEEDRPPWHGESEGGVAAIRWDKYTSAHAMRYVKVHKPRFLYLSLNDSDDYGHLGEYKNYLAALQSYDRWLEDLVDTLKTLGDYGKRTCILITTDHGRGKGAYWTDHGPHIPTAKYIWLFGQSPFTNGKPDSERSYSHADIRPTIEKLFGLQPLQCTGCGREMKSITGGL